MVPALTRRTHLSLAARVLALALAGGPAAHADEPGPRPPEGGEAPPAAPGNGRVDLAPSPGALSSPPSLDFDLLGAPPPVPEAVDTGALRLRRKMLTVHQGVGFGLLGLQLATTVVGQLNYSDRFHGGPDTARYRLAHKTLAYSTLGVFALNGLVALLAPSPIDSPRKPDRVMVHRIAMLVAALGMVAQGVIGIRTRERVGYLDQERLATTHLVIGYATLAATLVGVAVLVF